MGRGRPTVTKLASVVDGRDETRLSFGRPKARAEMSTSPRFDLRDSTSEIRPPEIRPPRFDSEVGAPEAGG